MTENKIATRLFQLIYAVPFFSIVISISCSNQHNKTNSGEVEKPQLSVTTENFSKDSIIPTVSCRIDPSQSFALYFPSSQNDTIKPPVIIFFDPHGSGSVPLRRYQNLAKEFGFILVGSNSSKNGIALDENLRIANSLVTEVKSRLGADSSRITVAGFSGGAKVAIAAGWEDKRINSIIYSGAAIPIQKPAHQVSILGFAGVNDMNYSDLIAFDQSLSQYQNAITHFLIEWNGKHEWPDSINFRNVLYWLSFNAMKSHQIAINKKMIQNFLNESIHINSGFRSWDEAHFNAMRILFVKDLIDVNELETRNRSIIATKSYEKDVADRQALIQMEAGMKQDYIKAFKDKDLNWWKNEINRLNSIADPRMKPVYQRLLGFVSLAGYSISDNAIHQGEFETAKKMLAIYKLEDPQNSDQPFLEACYYSRLGENEKAIASLKEAVRLGLTSRDKILNEEAFRSLQSMPQFDSIIKSLSQSAIANQ